MCELFLLMRLQARVDVVKPAECLANLVRGHGPFVQPGLSVLNLAQAVFEFGAATAQVR